MKEILTQKRCSGCKEVKDISEFSSKSKCKKCLKIEGMKYREANKDKVLLSHRIYNLLHKDEINKKSKKRTAENPEKRKEQVKKSYLKNIDKQKDKRQLFKALHPEKIVEYQKTYRDKHLETIREKAREYCKRFRDRDREKRAHYENKRRCAKNNIGGSFTKEEWNKLCEKYGYKCLCCGEKKKLTRDHVIPISLGGSNNIDNIQPLCHSCNSSKKDKHIDYR